LEYDVTPSPPVTTEDPSTAYTGALTQLSSDGKERRTVIGPGEGLVAPIGLTVGPDDAIYISNYGSTVGTGQVIRVVDTFEPAQYIQDALIDDDCGDTSGFDVNLSGDKQRPDSLLGNVSDGSNLTTGVTENDPFLGGPSSYQMQNLGRVNNFADDREYFPLNQSSQVEPRNFRLIDDSPLYFGVSQKERFSGIQQDTGSDLVGLSEVNLNSSSVIDHSFGQSCRRS
jgi:hypothetical protein